jgi:hypothetical protein
MTEREHAYAEHEVSHSGQDHDIAAGRGSRTAQLEAPTHPVMSGLIQRKARDDNGVADGADSALAAASSGSGAPLPETVMRKFESSLGADLSDVRVHTGPESAAAADAVGARAYTVGQNIHFAAGQYDPSSAGGEHLLAHEVAHTVQQQGGTPTRQHKLAVSAPQDAAEYEADRAADAMVSGQSAAITSAGAGVFRDKDEDKKKEDEKYKGPAPENQFDLTPADRVRIEELATAELRLLTTGTIGQAYTNFHTACNEVIARLRIWEKEEAEAQAKMIEFVFGAVGMLLGPLGAAAAGAAPGLAVQSKLAETLSAKLPAMELPPAVVKGQLIPGRRIPVDLSGTIASETAHKLAAKLTGDKVDGLIDGAAKKVGELVKGIKGSSPHRMAISYVFAMQEASHHSALQLRTSVVASTDGSALLGVHARYAGATPAVFRAEIDAKATHFVEQVGRTQAGGHGVGIMNAYGKDRLFTYDAISDDLVSGISYRFESWVTPDMQPMIFALNPNPQRFEPSKLRGRIPEPTLEAPNGRAGGETIVRMDAYGGSRLAAVHADVSTFGTTSYKFLRWIPQREEAEATAKGQQQLAGIPQFDPSKIDGHIPEPPKSTE